MGRNMNTFLVRWSSMFRRRRSVGAILIRIAWTLAGLATLPDLMLHGNGGFPKGDRA